MLPFKKILVPIDLAFGARAALETAAGLRHRSKGAITVCNVVEPLNVVPFYPGFEVDDYPARAADVAKQQLLRIVNDTVPFIGEVEAVVRLGRSADGILELAEEMGADLIVMGTHGRTGARRMLIGSVAEEVLRRASCPVMTLHEAEAADAAAKIEDCLSIGTVLVPTDFSETSRDGLRLACQVAKELGATLHVLHVVDSRSGDALEPLLGDSQPNVRAMFAEAKQEAHRAVTRHLAEIGEIGRGIDVKEHVALGHPAKEIAQFSKGYGADLIVMGSRGRTSFKELILGSTAERVVRLAKTPVLTVHGESKSAGAPAEEAAQAGA